VVAQDSQLDAVEQEALMAFLNATRREEALSPIAWSAILAQTGSAVAQGVVNNTMAELSTETLEGLLRDADFDATSTGYATFTDTAAVDEVAMTDTLSHLGIGGVPLNNGEYYYHKYRSGHSCRRDQRLCP